MTFSYLDGWWTDAGTFESLLRAANLVAQSGAKKAGTVQGCGGTADADRETAQRRARRIASPATSSWRSRDAPKGIGSVIVSPDSPELIDGVRVQPFTLWPDDRGYFLEVQRIGRGLAADFPAETTQISAALELSRERSRRSTITCIRPIAGLR